MYMGKHIDKYRLVNYFDVWGNKEVGWEVNNMCYEDGFIYLEEGTPNEITVKLIDFGFLIPSVKAEMLDIWNDYHMIEICEYATDKPICRLELVE